MTTDSPTSEITQASNCPPEGILPQLTFIRRQKLWHLGILAAVVLVNLAAINGRWWLGNDSALYLNIAHNIAEGQGYTLAGEPNTHVPPGFPFMLAGLIKIGLGSFAALNTLMALTAIATAVAAWLLLRELSHPHWALLIGGMFGLSIVLLKTGSEILSDVPFTFMVLSGLWMYMRWLRNGRGIIEAASLLLVAACWFRIAGFPLVFGAAISMAWNSWRNRRWRGLLNLALVAIAMAATLGVYIWWYKTNADPLAASYATQIGRIGGKSLWSAAIKPLSSLYESSGQLARLLTGQRMPLPMAIILLVVPFITAMIRRICKGDRIGPVAATCYIGALSLVLWQIRTRYMLVLLPLLTLYVLEGYAILLGTFIGKRRICVNIILCLLLTMTAMNLPLVVRQIFYKHQTSISQRQRGEFAPYHAVTQWLAHQPPGKLLADQPLALLSGRESPMLSSKLRKSLLSPAEFNELLAQLDISYVVLDTEEISRKQEKLPFFPALKKHLGQADFTSEQLQAYKVR